jgi:hypothetical protein
MKTIEFNEENLKTHLVGLISRYGSFDELSRVIDGVMYKWALELFNSDNVPDRDDAEYLIALRWLRDLFSDLKSEGGHESATLTNLKPQYKG